MHGYGLPWQLFLRFARIYWRDPASQPLLLLLICMARQCALLQTTHIHQTSTSAWYTWLP